MFYRSSKSSASHFQISQLYSWAACTMLGFALFSQSANAASAPQTVFAEGASVTYVQDSLWFSLLWITPSFLTPYSYEYKPYKELLNERLKSAGYETNVESGGIALAVIEDFAGKFSDYKPTPDYDTVRANPGAIAGTVVLAIVAKMALGVAPQLTVANNVNSFVVRDLPNAQQADIAADSEGRLLVIARICSTYGRCGSSVAVAPAALMSLDALREINMQQGLTRSVGLPPKLSR